MITSSFQKVSCPLWLQSSRGALLGPAVLSGCRGPPGVPCCPLWLQSSGGCPALQGSRARWEDMCPFPWRTEVLGKQWGPCSPFSDLFPQGLSWYPVLANSFFFPEQGFARSFLRVAAAAAATEDFLEM